MIPPGHPVALAAAVLVWAALFLLSYVYFAYPALLWVLGRFRNRVVRRDLQREDWPFVSITVPAYNEETQIEDLIRSLLALDYPADRIQRLIVSDASSDRTDEIVRRYADQGVELLRMSKRGGKTRAENAAAEHLRGKIVVNTDASIRIAPGSLKALVAAFADPAVGLASGRDISVGPGQSRSQRRGIGLRGVRDVRPRPGDARGRDHRGLGVFLRHPPGAAPTAAPRDAQPGLRGGAAHHRAWISGGLRPGRDLLCAAHRLPSSGSSGARCAPSPGAWRRSGTSARC